MVNLSPKLAIPSCIRYVTYCSPNIFSNFISNQQWIKLNNLLACYDFQFKDVAFRKKYHRLSQEPLDQT